MEILFPRDPTKPEICCTRILTYNIMVEGKILFLFHYIQNHLHIFGSYLTRLGNGRKPLFITMPTLMPTLIVQNLNCYATNSSQIVSC